MNQPTHPAESITSRPCDYATDQGRLAGFWLDCRAVSDVRKYPTIWRTRLLLSSRVWNQEKDAQLWENQAKELVGFAMLWRRQAASPYVVLDYYLHPREANSELFSKILEWGDGRANQIAQEQGTELTSYIPSTLSFAIPILAKHGYRLAPPSPVDYDVYFSKSILGDIPRPILPEGYHIRQLQNVDELQAYQALYGFAKVNPHHQQEAMESGQYFYFVVANPVGELVAYCECSIYYDEWKRTGQQIGWIDYVETKSNEQKKGLGQAVLNTGLLHLQKLGANTAMLITINSNTPAVGLYHKTGFSRIEIKDQFIYQKQILTSHKTNQ